MGRTKEKKRPTALGAAQKERDTILMILAVTFLLVGLSVGAEVCFRDLFPPFSGAGRPRRAHPDLVAGQLDGVPLAGLRCGTQPVSAGGMDPSGAVFSARVFPVLWDRCRDRGCWGCRGVVGRDRLWRDLPGDRTDIFYFGNHRIAAKSSCAREQRNISSPCDGLSAGAGTVCLRGTGGDAEAAASGSGGTEQRRLKKKIKRNVIIRRKILLATEVAFSYNKRTLP